MLKNQTVNVFLLTTNKSDMGLYSLGSLEPPGVLGMGTIYSRELPFTRNLSGCNWDVKQFCQAGSNWV